MVFRGSGHPPPQRPGERRTRQLGFEALLIAIVILGSFTWLAPKTHAATSAVPPILTYAGGAVGDGYSNYTSQLNTPTGVAVDSSGDVFIADTTAKRVRMVAGTTCSSSCLFGIATTKNSIYTIAGTGTMGYSGDGGPATSAQVAGPTGLAVDSAGDLIMADSTFPGGVFTNNRIRLVAATTSSAYGLGATTIGDIYTVAGTGESGAYMGDGAAATSARIYWPVGVAVDSSGNIIFSDNGNNVVRMVVQTPGTYYGVVATAGDIYTVAGNVANGSTAGYGGDTGSATAAAVKFSNVNGIAIDGCTSYLLYNCSGSILIADSGNQRIRMVAKTTCASGCAYGPVTTANHIYTIAGNGTRGYTGDNGLDTSAKLDSPLGIVVDSSGNLLITDSGFTNCGANTCIDSGNDNVRLVAKTTCASGCAYGVNSTANYIYTIAGSTSESSVGDGGAATSAFLDTPSGLALNSEGDVLIADSSALGNADRIRMVSEAANCSSSCVYGFSATTINDIYTMAGNGTEANATSGALASAAELAPGGVAVDSSGNVLIADTFNNRVKMVAAATCASSCTYGLPATTINYIYTIAGNGTVGTTGNAGPATSAELDNPYGVTVDSSGNVLIADTSNNRIQMLAKSTCSPAASCAYGVATTANDIYTVAGSATGSSGATGDTGAATSALLGEPFGVAVDYSGNLLIADTQNNKIRMVAAATCSSSCAYGVNTTANDIYTVAGNGTAFYFGDGAAATLANLNFPEGVAVDSSGNLLIADFSNSRIQMVAKITGTYYGVSTTANDIYTVAGSSIGSSGSGGDTGPATSALLRGPQGVAVDGSGNLLIADNGNNKIRMVNNVTGTYYGVSATAAAIYTIAGTGTQGYTGDGGLATSATLSQPNGIAVSASGNLFLSQYATGANDTSYGRIREVFTNAPAVTAISPGGGSTSGGTSVTITGTAFTAATSVMFGSTAATWYAINSDTSITATTPAESAATVDVTVTTANGTSATLTADQYTFAAPPTVTGVSPSSGGAFASVTITGTNFSGLTGASAVMFGATNALSYTVNSSTSITATAPPENAGTVDVVVTATGGPSATSSSDQFTFADGGSPITMFAGGGLGDGYSNFTSQLQSPTGVAVDSQGDVFIGDSSANRLRMLAGTTCSSGCLFGISTTKNSIYTIAGNGTGAGNGLWGIGGYAGDNGPATSGELDGPMGVALDSQGNVVMADSGFGGMDQISNHRIRLLSNQTCSSACPYGLASMSLGYIYTIAGNGTMGYTGDGGAATSAEVHGPQAVAVDSSGNVIISDSGNNVVRMIAAATCGSSCAYGLAATTANDIYTIAGNGTAGYTGDTGAATSAELNAATGIAIGGCTSYLLYNCSGSLIIADSGNNRIRMVAKTTCSGSCAYGVNTTANHIYTIAGNGTQASVDEVTGQPTTAEFATPNGIVLDTAGNILVDEIPNDRSTALNDVRLIANATGSFYGSSRIVGRTYTVVSSNGAADSTGDGGTGLAAHVDSPTGLTF
jgi:hypothetical protein